MCPNGRIIAGSVVSPQAAEELITIGGASVVKVGGSSTTDLPLHTGVAVSMLDLVRTCSRVAERNGCHLLVELKSATHGAAAKALAAGAHMVALSPTNLGGVSGVDQRLQDLEKTCDLLGCTSVRKLTAAATFHPVSVA